MCETDMIASLNGDWEFHKEIDIYIKTFISLHFTSNINLYCRHKICTILYTLNWYIYKDFYKFTLY